MHCAAGAFFWFSAASWDTLDTIPALALHCCRNNNRGVGQVFSPGFLCVNSFAFQNCFRTYNTDQEGALAAISDLEVTLGSGRTDEEQDVRRTQVELKLEAHRILKELIPTYTRDVYLHM